MKKGSGLNGCLVCQGHLYYGAQAAENIDVFFRDVPEVTEEELLQMMHEESSPVILRAFADAVRGMDSFDEDSIKTVFKGVMKAAGIKGKYAFMPVRIALTGSMHGPDMYCLITLLGKEKVLDRLEKRPASLQPVKMFFIDA